MKTHRLRIALSVHHELDPNSGAAGALLAYAAALEEVGHAVEIFSFDSLPRWMFKLPKPIHLRIAPLIFPWWLCSRVLPRIKKFDVIDFLSSDAWVIYSLLRLFKRRSFRTLLVTHSAGLEHSNRSALAGRENRVRDPLQPARMISSAYDEWYSNGWRLWEVKRAHQRSDLCFFLNRDDANAAIRMFGLEVARVKLTRNGLPACLMNVPVPCAEKYGAIKIAHIGSLSVAKGSIELIQAVSGLMVEDNRVHLKLVGTGLADEEVFSQFDERLRQRVENVRYFHRCDLPGLLAECEIKVFASLSDGFGMVLLEAMACHLAPISTANAGAREIISSPDEGVLIPPGDAIALAEAIRSLIRDDTRRQRLRERAFRRAQKFPWRAIAAERVQAYVESLGDQSSSSIPDRIVGGTDIATND